MKKCFVAIDNLTSCSILFIGGLSLRNRSPVNVMVEPELQEALRVVQDGLAKRNTLLMIGACRVDYKGRAQSKLGPGERVLMIKEDGAVLVHRSTGYEPVNWQPEGCLFQTHLMDDRLVIRAIRSRPREVLTLTFNRMNLVAQLDLVDRSEFVLYASEKDMQQAVLLNPELLEPSFKPITYEKKVEPGFVDLYGVDKDGRFVVVEIKRKTASREAVLQLAKYVESIRTMVNREVRGVLAAPSMARGVQRLLVTLGMDFKPLDPKKCAEILRKAETKKLVEFFEGHA